MLSEQYEGGRRSFKTWFLSFQAAAAAAGIVDDGPEKSRPSHVTLKASSNLLNLNQCWRRSVYLERNRRRSSLKLSRVTFPSRSFYGLWPKVFFFSGYFRAEWDDRLSNRRRWRKTLFLRRRDELCKIFSAKNGRHQEQKRQQRRQWYKQQCPA